MIPTLFGISIIAFLIIQLPPGDYLTSVLASMSDSGQTVDPAADRPHARRSTGSMIPILVQYWKWISGILLRGDFGYSFEWGRPVSELIWDRMGVDAGVSIASLLFVWAVSLPIGIYSAVRRHSIGDHVFTFLGFLGLAIPNFILALTLMYRQLQVSSGRASAGCSRREYARARLEPRQGRGTCSRTCGSRSSSSAPSGTAALIRILRANLTDELNKPYVVTARAKGLPEHEVILKYPVRIALNPFVSAIGWVLPQLISGVTITAIVLNLPTAGPLLLRALISQDMYLAGSFILLMGVLTLIGMLISDLLLALLDPRIRFT